MVPEAQGHFKDQEKLPAVIAPGITITGAASIFPIEITPPGLMAIGPVALRAPPLVVVAQVGQDIVPEVPVIVPPAIGLLVASEASVPKGPFNPPEPAL
jgi:hypothetical protein